jgi:hypothetical protein
MGLAEQVRHEGRARANHEERVCFVDLCRSIIEESVSYAIFVACVASPEYKGRTCGIMTAGAH